MKKIYQIPSFMVVGLNTRHSILGTSGDSQPEPPVDPTNPVGDDDGTYTKRHSVWDDDDWD